MNKDYIEYITRETGAYYGNKYIIQALYTLDTDSVESMWKSLKCKRPSGWTLCSDVTIPAEDEFPESTFPCPLDNTCYYDEDGLETCINDFLALDE